MSAFAPHDDQDTADYSFVSPDPARSASLAPEQSTSSDPDHNHANNPLLGNDNPLVSDLEQEVLDEYSRLLRNVNQVRHLAQFPRGALFLSTQQYKHSHTLPSNHNAHIVEFSSRIKCPTSPDPLHL